MSSNNRPIAVDLFAGAGGMTLGFEQAGFDVLASVEIDPIHCATHEYNFPLWKVLCRSAVDVTGEEIRELSDIGKKEIDVVFGGPPCQGFSLIGKRDLEDPRNNLVHHFVRLVLEMQPNYFVLENVRGLTIGEPKLFLADVIERFKSAGYLVEEQYRVLNACHYGVPQDRQRLFLLGCKSGLKLPSYPRALTVPPSTKTALFAEPDLPCCPTVLDSIGDLPEANDFPELLRSDSVRAVFGRGSEYVLRLRGAESSSGDCSYPRAYDPSMLTSSLRTIHTQESIDRFLATRHGDTEPISRFRKLDPNGICNTLRAGTPSDRGAFTSPRPIHPFTPRCITVREAARLHSYPDWFRFHATKWHGFRQVGNSVPPLLAQAVASELMSELGEVRTRPSEDRPLGDSALLHMDMTEAASYFKVDPKIMGGRRSRSEA